MCIFLPIYQTRLCVLNTQYYICQQFTVMYNSIHACVNSGILFAVCLQPFSKQSGIGRAGTKNIYANLNNKAAKDRILGAFVEQ